MDGSSYVRAMRLRDAVRTVANRKAGPHWDRLVWHMIYLKFWIGHWTYACGDAARGERNETYENDEMKESPRRAECRTWNLERRVAPVAIHEGRITYTV